VLSDYVLHAGLLAPLPGVRCDVATDRKLPVEQPAAVVDGAA